MDARLIDAVQSFGTRGKIIHDEAEAGGIRRRAEQFRLRKFQVESFRAEQRLRAPIFSTRDFRPIFETVKSARPELLPLLKQYFGFTSFRPLQEEIIRDSLAGKDVFALLPTGGGKSLCFQLPALTRDGLTVVVSPLIALMKDQVDALQAERRSRDVPEFLARGGRIAASGCAACTTANSACSTPRRSG